MAGYLPGKMVSATLPPRRLLSSTPAAAISPVHLQPILAIVSSNAVRDFNQSSFLRCLMRSTTMEKGKYYKKLVVHKFNEFFLFSSAHANCIPDHDHIV